MGDVLALEGIEDDRILDRPVAGDVAVDLGERDDLAHVAAGVEAPRLQALVIGRRNWLPREKSGSLARKCKFQRKLGLVPLERDRGFRDHDRQFRSDPGGHPNSPTDGHLKIPHSLRL